MTSRADHTGVGAAQSGHVDAVRDGLGGEVGVLHFAFGRRAAGAWPRRGRAYASQACRLPSRSRPDESGRLAQLGERRVRNAEVGSSSLLPSTNIINAARASWPLRRLSFPAATVRLLTCPMSLRSDAFPIRLRKLEVTLAVCRCNSSAPVEPWMRRGPFWSITQRRRVVDRPSHRRGRRPGASRRRRLRSSWSPGPSTSLSPASCSRISAPLADAGIPVFVTATFDTDYVLVPAARELDARQAWFAAGLAIDR